MQFIWSRDTGFLSTQTEAILLFTTHGGGLLKLASNYPYEVWMDERFIGEGGFRCVPANVNYELWDATNAKTVIVRLHWLNSKKTHVYYRCLFDDAFLWDENAQRQWQCSHESSINFAAKPSTQLPRQNIVSEHLQQGKALALHTPRFKIDWEISKSLIKRPQYLSITPKKIKKSYLLGQKNTEFVADKVKDLVLYVKQGLPEKAYYQLPDSEKNYKNRFDKTHDETEVAEKLPAGLICISYDLGKIALHRFQLQTQQSCILCYSEIAEINEIWQSANRHKVHLADTVIGEVELAAPFGSRGLSLSAFNLFSKCNASCTTGLA